MAADKAMEMPLGGNADAKAMNMPMDEKACLDLIDRAKAGDVDGVGFLLERCCVDVNFADTINFNFTALHVAASQGKTEVVRMLLDQKGIVVDPRSESEQTPLIMAARSKHTKTVGLLVAAGADLDAKPNHGSMSKSARDYMTEAAAGEGGEEAVTISASRDASDASGLHLLSKLKSTKQRSHYNLYGQGLEP
jgi:hypothetical protein